VSIFDSTGALIAFNDDANGTYDSLLIFSVPAAGTYYVVVGAYLSPFPSNRFDSATGPGYASEGTYDVTIGVDVGDRDYFTFTVEPGDIIAGKINLFGGARLTLFDPAGVAR